jgi:hypothetical protein
MCLNKPTDALGVAVKNKPGDIIPEYIKKWVSGG